MVGRRDQEAIVLLHPLQQGVDEGVALLLGARLGPPLGPRRRRTRRGTAPSARRRPRPGRGWPATRASAASNRSPMFRPVEPTHLSMIRSGLTASMGRPRRAARWWARVVLPTPGGPSKIARLRGAIPTAFSSSARPRSRSATPAGRPHRARQDRLGRLLRHEQLAEVLDLRALSLHAPNMDHSPPGPMPSEPLSRRQPSSQRMPPRIAERERVGDDRRVGLEGLAAERLGARPRRRPAARAAAIPPGARAGGRSGGGGAPGPRSP
jgi:hypothetical protein